jgi:uncharacterized membrane protein YeaQ/YmgE (transglycosylase-associated protein family)
VYLIWAAIIGLIAGALAKLLMPGKDPGGCLITSALGIAGAMFASFIGQSLGFYRPGQSAGFIGAVIGAVLILAIYRVIIGRRQE